MATRKGETKIIIEGVTESGAVFRPSDWAERMSGSLSTFRNQRVIYSPLLRPAVKDGNKCVILDSSLKESNPTLYQQMMDFAKTNHLKIYEDTEGDDHDTEKPT